MVTCSYGLTRLVLTDFRNYASLSLLCKSMPVILTGPNGAGKTNILEAISFFSPGRGLRRAKFSEVARISSSSDLTMVSGAVPVKGNPQKSWGVAATLEAPDGTWELGTALDTTPTRERRIVKVGHDLLKSQTELTQYVHVLWITPQMDRLFQEGASTRRRFLDRLVYSLDSDHVGRVTRYEHYLRERGRLLKEGTRSRDAGWLDALEANISREGIAICQARALYIDRLYRVHRGSLGDFPRGALALSGRLESWMADYSLSDVEQKFQETLRHNRSHDRETGAVSYGPHRTDFVVTYEAKNCLAALCSTGEQKALLVSLVFAAARLHHQQGKGVPLMLLDEIVAHLDEKRREALFEEILSLKMQAWMTGTDPELFGSLAQKVQHFSIENARVFPTIGS